ncbi:MAG: S26 family signal peptidase [Planctomycetes bacterium]|nr:S26 family signal peptidase [Planctomycetota bacterium]
MFSLLKVEGNSLEPIVLEGDFVIASKIPFFIRPVQAGDLIVFQHVLYKMMIKLVERYEPETGDIYVAGTQSGSIDSRIFGPIRMRDVVGKVIWHIKRNPKKRV